MARGQGEDGTGYTGPTPPAIAPPTWGRRTFVERARELAAVADHLAASHVIAIDAEFVQTRHRAAGEPAHRLALLQFAVDDGYGTSYVVDALRLGDLSPLEAPLLDGTILKLFHGISSDARVLASRGLYARHTLDLEAVSRSIFGQHASSLQAMLQRACDIWLDKTLRRADWGHRPLNTAMIAYAARDAEMTYVLYEWLKTHYRRVVANHELPADPIPPPVARWLLPVLEATSIRSVDQALIASGVNGDQAALERDLARALEVVTRPGQRARVLRLIGDLGLIGLASDVRPYLAAPTTEERASAARALGRLRDWQSQPDLEALLHDPVYDVRKAAQAALDWVKRGPHQSVPRDRSSGQAPGGSPIIQSGGPIRQHQGPRTWIIGGDPTDAKSDQSRDPHDWRTTLRQHFGGEMSDGADDSSAADPEDDADDDNE